MPGVAEVTFDRDSLTATVTMKDANCELNSEAVNKALTAKSDRFMVGSFKEKK